MSKWSTPRPTALIVSMLLSAAPFICGAADDAYLQAIEAETDSVTVDQDGVINAGDAPPANEAPPESIETAAGDTSTSGTEVDLAGFEERLASESRSLHRFYDHLSNGDKQKVFEEYKNNQDIKALRPTIVRLYTGR